MADDLNEYRAVTLARRLAANGMPLIQAAQHAAQTHGVGYRLVLDCAAAAIEGCAAARRHYDEMQPGRHAFNEDTAISPALEQEIREWHAQRRK